MLYYLKSKSFISDAVLIIPWLLVCILYLFGFQISETLQYILFIISLAFLGIPHGALDHLVEKQNNKLNGTMFSLKHFLLKYIVQMTLFAILWIISPTLSLLIFLLISAIHFGETDINNHSFISFLYGIGLLFFLLLSHIETVMVILNSIPSFADVKMGLLLKNRKVWLGLFACTPILVILINPFQPQNKIKFLLRILFILFIIYQLPLLLSFTFYFSCWHSIRSLNFIRKHLSIQNDQLSWIELWLKAMPFTCLAIVFMAALIYILYTYLGLSVTLMSLFISIAILTAPHLGIMSEMYSNLKKSH